MTRDKVSYEWCIECADEFGDVESVHHADTLAGALLVKGVEEPDWHKVSIALSRTEGNDLDGINWRGYAYLTADGIEPVFSSYHEEEGGANDGADVPQRFLKEVAAAPTNSPRS